MCWEHPLAPRLPFGALILLWKLRLMAPTEARLPRRASCWLSVDVPLSPPSPAGFAGCCVEASHPARLPGIPLLPCERLAEPGLASSGARPHCQEGARSSQPGLRSAPSALLRSASCCSLSSEHGYSSHEGERDFPESGELALTGGCQARQAASRGSCGVAGGQAAWWAGCRAARTAPRPGGRRR